MMDQWRPIPGFDGWYEINRHAEVRGWRLDGGAHKAGVRAKEPHIIKPVMVRRSSGYRYLSVGLWTPGGKKVGKAVKLLMRDVWMQGKKSGMVVTILDENPSNCSLHNLAYVPVNKGSKKYFDSSRKPVAKYNLMNEVVAFYKSVQEAANKEYLTLSGMRNRIRRKSVVDGFYFKFER